MSEYLIQDTTLTGIADAIRGKTGGTEPVAVSDMAAQIEGIQAGGGDIDALIDRSITEISSNVTRIGNSAFQDCINLTMINFPVATEIGNSAFNTCSKLTTLNFPVATKIGNSAFNACSKVTTVNFPVATNIGTNAFENCINLTMINFPVATYISSYAFQNCSVLTTADFPVVATIAGSVFSSCSNLEALILRSGTMVKLSNKSAFNSSSISRGTGYIYVPSALIEDYKVATNWSTYAAQFRALEDYTVDGTVTGELDPAKTGT